MESLCCAAEYTEAEISHIPKNVLEVSYGCGSPTSLANIKEGETVVDLGSGGGIDCFIAARKVGRSGWIIGIDMTDKMIGIAKKAASSVAKNLGYDIVEFKKGFLEDIPLESGTADLVTSNCVLNLSADKGTVFEEIYKVLKPTGRFCISDVVSDKELPEHIRNDKQLWGECLAGALTEDSFIRAAREAGFYGLLTVSRSLYRKLDGIRFDSIVLNGYKLQKGSECVYAGQYAIYNGPFKAVQDDDGHEYPAGIPVKVCTETVEKLNKAPYTGLFSIIGPKNELQDPSSCVPEKCC
jgi:SAM-dependent methyltransferase